GQNSATLFITPPEIAVTDYYVSYGVSPGQLPFGTSVHIPHSSGVVELKINDLKPNTQYYFEVRAGNGCALGPNSTIKSITTGIVSSSNSSEKKSSSSENLASKIVVSSVNTSYLSPTQIKISWTTNIPTSASVLFARTQEELDKEIALFSKSTSFPGELTEDHSVVLSNLSPNQNYVFKIVDQSSGFVDSSTRSFSTKS